MRIDHVIYGTTDLEAAATRLEAELGLPVQPGGRHDGQGSHNKIVPLGPGYLELLAIADPQEAAASPIGRLLLDVITGDGLLAWAVFVDDIQRLGLEVHTVSRGGRTASVAGLAEALREPFLPFFVASDQPRTWPPGEGLTWVEVAGDEARLRDWLHGADLPVRVVEGEPAARAVSIGEREFRP